MKIKEIITEIENIAPLSIQESYDNAGLLVGDKNNEATGVLITLDITEEIIDEAERHNCNLIVSHHPIIFSGLKKITGKNLIERCVIKAIKKDIALYAAHTNIDSVKQGVNKKICDKLNIHNPEILIPGKEKLIKLAVFTPTDYADKVRTAIFNAGAGEIGEYDSCSYNSTGYGTFKAGENANPLVGEKNKLHREEEIKIESIFPDYLQEKVITTMLNAHPYEEAAYDLYPLNNKQKLTGAGMIGFLEKETDVYSFMNTIKSTFNTPIIRYSPTPFNKIKKVAIVGGSGSFAIKAAINAKADILITGDIKYHQFFEAENKIILADIGHFESEQYTKELFHEIITKKFPKFAVRLTEMNTNPIKYY